MDRSASSRVLLASVVAILIVAVLALTAALTTGPAAIGGHARPVIADGSPFGGGSSGGGGASGGW